jgi:hypothetical protein
MTVGGKGGETQPRPSATAHPPFSPSPLTNQSPPTSLTTQPTILTLPPFPPLTHSATATAPSSSREQSRRFNSSSLGCRLIWRVCGIFDGGTLGFGWIHFCLVWFGLVSFPPLHLNTPLNPPTPPHPQSPHLNTHHTPPFPSTHPHTPQSSPHLNAAASPPKLLSAKSILNPHTPPHPSPIPSSSPQRRRHQRARLPPKAVVGQVDPDQPRERSLDGLGVHRLREHLLVFFWGGGGLGVGGVFVLFWVVWCVVCVCVGRVIRCGEMAGGWRDWDLDLGGRRVPIYIF